MNEIIKQRIESEARRYCQDKNYILPDDTKLSLEALTALDAYIESANFILQNQWISVDEALPKEKFDDGYQFVFVRIHLYDDTFYYDTDYIRKGKWKLHKNQKITHWMEIPSLKGGEK